MPWPPSLSDDQLEAAISNARDWQLTRGSLLKQVNFENEHLSIASPVGVSLYPTLFPRALFESALHMQSIFNKLYAAVACDEEWLYSTLGELIKDDPLTRSLWTIHQEVKKAGYTQDYVAGIFRSDYMLHESSAGNLQLKQVEFNTISCAGGIHGEKASHLHRYLLQNGSYEPHQPFPGSFKPSISNMPSSNTLQTLVAGLAAMHKAYINAKSSGVSHTGILMVVQPNNFNIADERPIEYGLWEESVPIYRVEFGEEVLAHTSLSPSRELLYHPPSRPSHLGPVEISLVYFRSGFEIEEYTPIGYKCRLQLELSNAIKCPSVLSHLTTFKKVQEALAEPGTLDRFISPEEAAIVEDSFTPMYPMDDSEAGRKAMFLALNPETAQNHVLKPSLEGGGHNIYGQDISLFLAKTPKESWNLYILMEKIQPPLYNNILLSPTKPYSGPVVSELGVFGVCYWKQSRTGNEKGVIIEHEEPPCWSFKTKSAGVNEMSVVKGYGCFDSPLLVDDETLSTLYSKPSIV